MFRPDLLCSSSKVQPATTTTKKEASHKRQSARDDLSNSRSIIAREGECEDGITRIIAFHILKCNPTLIGCLLDPIALSLSDEMIIEPWYDFCDCVICVVMMMMISPQLIFSVFFSINRGVRFTRKGLTRCMTRWGWWLKIVEDWHNSTLRHCWSTTQQLENSARDRWALAFNCFRLIIAIMKRAAAIWVKTTTRRIWDVKNAAREEDGKNIYMRRKRLWSYVGRRKVLAGTHEAESALK